MEKATRQHTKDHNSRLVLRTIFNGPQISRADVARLTGLTRPTVSTIVADLIDRDLIMETGQGPSAGGTRPTLLSVNGDGRRLLAVDLSGNDFRAARLNLKGEIEARTARPAAGLRGQAALNCVYDLVAELLPDRATPLLGIGVATPGLVAPNNGIVLRAVNLEWVNLPLRDLLATRFGHSVHVANDSHMAALAEFTYGDPAGSDNLIAIRVGRGVGAGIILGGRPFYGDGFGAGEIGHVVVDAEGALCTCGNRGCLETTSSVPAILARAHAALPIAPQPPSWSQFVAAVLAHDPAAVDVAVYAGRHLGAAIAQLVGAYNIQRIALVGRIADLGDVLLDAVVAEMHQRVLPAMAETTDVRFSSLAGNRAAADIVMLGCSAFLLHRELGII